MILDEEPAQPWNRTYPSYQKMNAASVLSLVEIICGSNDQRNVSIKEQKSAMSNMEQIELHEGFLTALLLILGTVSIRTECRLYSSIQLKNTIGKRWVPRGGKYPPIHETEKQAARDYLLQPCFERDSRIVAQLALVIGKISRHDWPDKWPQLFTVLVNNLQSDDQIVRSNAMLFTGEAIGELSSKTLSFSKSEFASLCLNLFPVISAIWNSTIQSLFLLLRQPQEDNIQVDTDYALQYLYSTTVLLRKILSCAFPEMTQAGNLGVFFEHWINAMKSLLENLRDIRMALYRSNIFLTDHAFSNFENLQMNKSLKTALKLRRLIETVSKIPTDLLSMFPLDMTPYLEGFLVFEYDQLMKECQSCSECGQRVDACFSLSAICFLDKALSCKLFSDESQSDERTTVSTGAVARMANRFAKAMKAPIVDDETATNLGRQVKASFFNNVRCCQLLEVCLTYLLRYEKQELNEWTEDGEHFYLHQQGLQGHDTVRTSSELLYLSLLNHCSNDVMSYVINQLLDLPRQLACTGGSVSDPEIEYWDAVYLTVGLGANIIANGINASDWLQNSLGNIVNNVLARPSNGSLRAGQQLLRSRLIWLLSTWMYYWDSNVVAILTQIIVSMIESSSQSDLVVKLNAISALEVLLRSDKFNSSYLLPLLQRLIEALCSLISDVEDNETKAHIVTIFGEITLAMGDQLQPILLPLVNYLGNIWRDSDDKSPLRRTVLEVLTTVVRTARKLSASLGHVIWPLIHFAVSSNSSVIGVDDSTGDADTNSFLVEQGISLWLAMCRNITELNENTLTLFNACLFNLFKDDGAAGDLDVEIIKEIMMIVEAYAISGGVACFEFAGASLQLMFDKVLGKVSPRAVPYVIRPLEAFALRCPTELSSFVLHNGTMSVMLRACCAYFPGLDEIYGDYKEAEISTVTYLSFIARVLLCSSQTIFVALTTIAQDLAVIIGNSSVVNAEQLFNQLIQLMINMFDTVGCCAGGMWRRKLWALALLSIYPTTSFALLEIFPEVLTISDSVICEEEDRSGDAVSQLTATASSMIAFSTEDAAFVNNDMVQMDELTALMTDLIRVDIVNQSSLIHIAKQKLQDIRKSISESDFTKLFELIPAPIRQKFY